METITLEQLRELFAGLRAQTSWDVDGEMLWGYYFTSKNPEKLEHAGKALARAGYRVVALFESDDEPTHVLHVERAEVHTPETLFSRNQQLESFATEFELDSYDGMDVNPVEGESEGSPDDSDDTDETGDAEEEFYDDEMEEPIENPGVLEAIAEMTKEPCVENESALTAELQCAVFLVPVFGESEPESSPEGGETVQLLACTNEEGAEYLPLFTDAEALKEWTDEPVSAMVLEAAEVWEFILSQPECSGGVINPGAASFQLTRRLVEFLHAMAQDAADTSEDEEEDGGEEEEE